MKLLFDTHTFIWWDSNRAKLSQTALTVLEDSSHILLLSVVSIWEIQIKQQLGKLTLNQLLSLIKRKKGELNYEANHRTFDCIRIVY